jgi:hypothetical protein
VHSRLDQQLQPLLQDPVAKGHPLGAAQVLAVASEDQGDTRLV